MSFPTDSRIWSASPPLLAIKVIPTIWSSGFNCGRLWICFFFITSSGSFAIRFFQQTQRTTVYLSPPSFFLLFNAFQPPHLLLPTGKYQGSLTCKQGFIRIPAPVLTADFPKLLLLPLCLSPPAPARRRYLTLPLCNFLILKCRPCNQFLQDWTSSISEAMVPFLNPSPTTSTMKPLAPPRLSALRSQTTLSLIVFFLQTMRFAQTPSSRKPGESSHSAVIPRQKLSLV